MLSDFYKNNCVWMTNSNTNNYDIAVTKTFEELFPDDTDIDLSILLNNGSTFIQLNSGAKGIHPIVYPDNNNLSMIGDYSVDVKFLGSALCVADLNGSSISITDGVLFNLSKKIGMNITDIGFVGWEQFKNLRFIVNTRPHKSTTIQGSDVKWDIVDNWLGFKNFVIKPWYNYVNVDSNFVYSSSRGRVNHYENIPDDMKNTCYLAEYSAWLTNYDAELPDSTTLTNKNIGVMMFFFAIDGDVFITLHPEQCYPININKRIPTYSEDGVEKNIGIGQFMSDETVYKALPDNDNVKGWCFKTLAVSGYYRQCSAYVNTINALVYFVNSTGLRWMNLEAGIGTAGDYRSDVRLGVMNSSGVIVHDQWLLGETEILTSDNINKNGDYTKLPDRDTPQIDDNDSIDSMDYGLGFGVGGLVTYYCVTNSQILKDLSDALSNPEIIPTNKDVLPNLISLMWFPVDENELFNNLEDVEIEIAGVHTTVHAYKIQSTNATIVLGSYTINGKFGNAENPHFLDYEPYTNIELYIPFCSWITIPVAKCMYKTITVELLYDYTTGGIIGIVTCDGCIIATCGGNMSANFPFSAVAVGQQKAIQFQGIIDMLGHTKNFVVGAATGNVLQFGSSIGSAIGTFAQNYIAQNQNFTEQKGGTSDRTSLGLPKQCYIKIQRPITLMPDNYKNVYGYLCNKTTQIKNITGYTICNNVDCSNISIATKTEKDLIKNLLETGIYV